MTTPEADLPVPVLVWCPFAGEDEARRVAGQLLDEGLIACANVMPGMVSLYQWQGQRGEGNEAGALFKTNASLIEPVILRIAQLHSYDSPAIMAWPCPYGSPATNSWLGALQTGTQDDGPG